MIQEYLFWMEDYEQVMNAVHSYPVPSPRISMEAG